MGGLDERHRLVCSPRNSLAVTHEDQDTDLIQVRRPALIEGRLLFRIHYIIEMIRWTGLAPWEFED